MKYADIVYLTWDNEMKQQTNTADMLDEAVEYVKQLQRQVQVAAWLHSDKPGLGMSDVCGVWDVWGSFSAWHSSLLVLTGFFFLLLIFAGAHREQM